MLSDSIYYRTPGIVLREELDDWALLFNPDSGKVAGINAIGVVLWKILKEHHTPSGIIRAMEDYIEEIPTDVENHVIEYLSTLSERGFVTIEFS